MIKLYTTDSGPIHRTKNIKMIGQLKTLNIIMNIKKYRKI